MPEETPPVDPEKKEEADKRGIGRTKAHIYVEDPEEKEDPFILCVSLADFFEGESISVVVKKINQDGTLGAVIDAIPAPEDSPALVCKGKIAGIDLLTCTNNTSYPLPEEDSARITISYLGVEQTLDITPRSRSGWLDWAGLVV